MSKQKKEDPKKVVKIIFTDEQDKIDLYNLARNRGYSTAGAYARAIVVKEINSAPLRDKLPRDDDDN